jgi:hypothetical protein
LNEVKRYAKRAGITDFPVFIDGIGAYKSVTPMTQRTHLELCAIGPDMRILNCASGHKSYERLMGDIRTHIASAQGSSPE